MEETGYVVEVYEELLHLSHKATALLAKHFSDLKHVKPRDEAQNRLLAFLRNHHSHDECRTRGNARRRQGYRDESQGRRILSLPVNHRGGPTAIAAGPISWASIKALIMTSLGLAPKSVCLSRRMVPELFGTLNAGRIARSRLGSMVTSNTIKN
jgi:hypothetical protein